MIVDEFQWMEQRNFNESQSEIEAMLAPSVEDTVEILDRNTERFK